MTGPTTAPRNPASIPAGQMREHLAAGRARPLLPGYFPVPVVLDGQWWHVPVTDTADRDRREFVPATAEQTTRFTALAGRRAAADQAVHAADRDGPR